MIFFCWISFFFVFKKFKYVNEESKHRPIRDNLVDSQIDCSAMQRVYCKTWVRENLVVLNAFGPNIHPEEIKTVNV